MRELGRSLKGGDVGWGARITTLSATTPSQAHVKELRAGKLITRSGAETGNELPSV